MTDKSMIEQVKEACIKLRIADVGSFRSTLAVKILLADVRSRGSDHINMASHAIEHADELMKLLSRKQ